LHWHDVRAGASVAAWSFRAVTRLVGVRVSIRVPMRVPMRVRNKSSLGHPLSQRCHPQEALYLPTFSHLFDCQ